MKTKKNPAEMQNMKDFSCRVIDFMATRSPVEYTSIFELSKSGVIAAYNRGNWKGLQQVLRDIEEWAQALPAPDYNELNTLLMNEYGWNLEDINKKSRIAIETVLKRNSINNEHEYRVIEREIDRIYADPSKADDLTRLNKLLVMYHERK